MTRPPDHLARRPELLARLRRWATGTRGLYGVPVYLCGSALFDFNAEPRDWDLRIRLETSDFVARYGDVYEWEREGASGLWTAIRWRWSADCVKHSKDATRTLQRIVYFQVYPATHWTAYEHLPRYQLDCGAP